MNHKKILALPDQDGILLNLIEAAQMLEGAALERVLNAAFQGRKWDLAGVRTCIGITSAKLKMAECLVSAIGLAGLDSDEMLKCADEVKQSGDQYHLRQSLQAALGSGGLDVEGIRTCLLRINEEFGDQEMFRIAKSAIQSGNLEAKSIEACLATPIGVVELALSKGEYVLRATTGSRIELLLAAIETGKLDAEVMRLCVSNLREISPREVGRALQRAIESGNLDASGIRRYVNEACQKINGELLGWVLVAATGSKRSGPVEILEYLRIAHRVRYDTCIDHDCLPQVLIAAIGSGKLGPAETHRQVDMARQKLNSSDRFWVYKRALLMGQCQASVLREWMRNDRLVFYGSQRLDLLNFAVAGGVIKHEDVPKF